MNSDLKNIDKELILLLIIGIAYGMIVGNFISGLKQLPSPIFGGDYYYQLGAIYHMYDSPVQDWLSTSNGIGERPAYMITYSALVTVFGKILGLQPMQAMFSLNSILPLVSVLLYYFLFKRVFGDAKIAFLGALLALGYTNFPILKYTDFVPMVITPLFLIAAHALFKEQNKKTAAFFGIAYGITALSHGTAFLFENFVFLGIVAYLLWQDNKNKKLVFDLNYLMEKKYLLAAFAIGFLIAQLYWFGPLFIHGGQAKLGSHIWSYPFDLGNPATQITFLIDRIRELFFDTDSILEFIKSILTLAGVIVLLANKETRDKNHFVTVVFLSVFILNFSYFITMPLFDTNFIPAHIFDLYLKFIAIFFVAIALGYAFELINTSNNNAVTYAYVALAGIILLLAFVQYNDWMTNKLKNDQFWKMAGGPQYQPYAELQNYILKNTNVTDRILSNNELSFMLNGLTGRKVLATRRAHNEPFVDFDRYQMDAAVILYGNNKEKKIRLMKDYDIKYIYVDIGWPGFDYQLDENGNAIGYSDPFLFFYSSEKERELQENGIKYAKVTGYVDPAVRGGDVRKYNLLIVSPASYEFSGAGLWQNDIDDLLTPVWVYQDGGRPVAVLYKVNV